MFRSAFRPLLISSAAALPMLAVAAPEPAPAISGDEGGFALYQPIVEGLTEEAILAIEEAEAASALPLPNLEPRAFSSSLQDATGDRDRLKLDWRNPHINLRFDLSQADQVEALFVTLSADPLPGVDTDVPLMFQFNGSDPEEIDTRGKGFDTVIELDRARVRETGNVLRLSYAASCDTPMGGYRINLDESRLDVSVVPDPERQTLADIERRLSSLTFAPQSVGLIAQGPTATRLQALAAQSLGLRMDQPPTFAIEADQSDFDLIMMERSQLASFTDEADILSATGPMIALSTVYPDRLFLTGDTPDEVLESVNAFATASLPKTRTVMTTPQDVLGQMPLGVDRRLIETQANLDLVSVQTGTHRDYQFDVSDPAASEGHLILRLTRDDQTLKGTRLIASLNGVSLGEAVVRGKRKTVTYPIRKGLLLGTGNRLELTTQDASDRPRCEASPPFIAIAEGSELRLNQDTPTPPSDLSRFAANGSIFSDHFGQNTRLILPETDADFIPALSVVAKLAQTSGHSWTRADVVRGEADLSERNVLIIKPHDQIEREYTLDAPHGLQSAWRGHTLEDENSSDFVEQFASLDGEAALQHAVQTLRSASQVEQGGVAAIYADRQGRMIGIISNAAETDFTSALTPLQTDLHWNSLKGGVSRWNDSIVMMAQAALPTPGSVIIEQPEVRTPSLADRAKALTKRMPALVVPKPELDGVNGWIDQRWMNFSDTLQTQSEKVEITQVADQVQGQVEGLSATADQWRTGLWHHLDIADPSLKTSRVGRSQVIPATLGLIILFLLGLIGMTFAAPLSPASRGRGKRR